MFEARLISRLLAGLPACLSAFARLLARLCHRKRMSDPFAAISRICFVLFCLVNLPLSPGHTFAMFNPSMHPYIHVVIHRPTP